MQILDPRTHCVAQADLEFTFLLSQPPKCYLIELQSKKNVKSSYVAGQNKSILREFSMVKGRSICAITVRIYI